MKSTWHSFYSRLFFGEITTSSQGGTIKECDLNTFVVCPSSTVIRSVNSIDPRGRLIFYDLHSADYLAAFYSREFLPSFKLCYIIYFFKKLILTSCWPYILWPLTPQQEEHWPLFLSLVVIPTMFQLMLLPWFPESPRYLLIEKRNVHATITGEEASSIRRI